MNDLEQALRQSDDDLSFYLESVTVPDFRKQIAELLGKRESRDAAALKQSLIEAINRA